MGGLQIRPCRSPQSWPATGLSNPVSPVSLLSAFDSFPANDPAHPGLATLVAQLKTAPGWHIYATGALSGPAMATTLELKLPEGIARPQLGTRVELLRSRIGWAGDRLRGSTDFAGPPRRPQGASEPLLAREADIFQ